MPRHLISDAHEWINEIPTVPIPTRTKPNPKESTELRPSACADGEYESERNELSESTENEIIRDIYKEKESLKGFLFNESNKINRTAIKLIMSKWAILESKLIESILENEKAKAKISELKMEKLESKSKTLPTYAGILNSTPAGISRTQPRDNLKQKTEVTLIRPTKGDDKITNDEIKVNVTKALEKIKNKLEVKSIRQMNRKGLVLEIDSTKDKEMIKAAKLEKNRSKAIRTEKD